MSYGRKTVKAALSSIGLLDPARAAVQRVSAARKQRYYAAVVELYRSPFAKPMESYSEYERRERAATVGRARERYEADRRLVEEMRGRDAKSAAAAIVERMIDGKLAPRFYDYDYLDDIVGIVGGRYCSDEGCDAKASGEVLDALCTLSGAASRDALPDTLRQLLGSEARFVPQRSDVTAHMREVIPDLADEFISLKAERNEDRFLEINREYSRRQAHSLGLWDIRDLSLLRGYERDHHLLLRTLVGLIGEGEISSADEVLLIGPRHIDEVVFFRKTLGLRKAIGLDLFPYGGDKIIAGDMHRMPFEAGRFRLVFCAGTLSYAYNARRVVEEIARVSTRPGYVFLIDAGARHEGPSALGRSDIPGVEAMIGLFHRHRFQVFARDEGRSLAPHLYESEPCLALRLDA